MMENKPSDRLIDQRLRNRIMEAVLGLAEGSEDVQRSGPVEYFESFYDFIPHRDDGRMRANNALTAEEMTLLTEVSAILDDACDATTRGVTAKELIASGWPERVRPVARRALALMLQRGRFDEEREEEESSSPVRWP